jgi:AraC-like DNA-binding protein
MRPDCMSPRLLPCVDRTMDLLSDVLRQAGLQRRLLDVCALSTHGALRFPCDRSIGFHVAIGARLYVHGPDLAEPLALEAGDLVLMARGCEHVLATSGKRPRGAIPAADAVAGGPVSAPAAGVVSGAYQLWNAPLHPLFAELPRWSVVRAAELGRLSPLALTVDLLRDELQRRELGSGDLVSSLMDVTFTYLLREIVARGGAAANGWSGALRDRAVRSALELLHGDVAFGWTLDELARRVGVSRSVLAARFRTAVGDTPLNHLRTLRMQAAMRLLAETDERLDAVASAVGYQDAFGFSKVFKKVVGESPRDFRRREAEDRSSPWRFRPLAQGR